MSRCRAILVVAILSVSPASAQDVSGYIAGSLFVAPWSPRDVSGSPLLSYDNEGRTNRFMPGATVEAGVNLGPRVGPGVEIALAPRRTIDQTHFHFNPFKKEARYRDTTVLAVSRWGRGGAAGIDFSTQVSPRVSVGPQFRLTYTDRGDIATVPEFLSFGIPKVTYRIGLAVRVEL